MTSVAYQGIKGSFSYLAAERFCKALCDLGGGKLAHSPEYFGTIQFREIFNRVAEGKSDLGVVPVENSLAGSVQENLDLLAKSNAQIVGEYDLRVEHHLLVCAPEGTAQNPDLRKITRVFSHSKALEQCERFFELHPWIEEVVYSDTARAAQFVAQNRDAHFGAIASEFAANEFGLCIAQRNIEDDPHNFTRFAIIASDSTKTSLPAQRPANKCSLLFSLNHEPGSLVKALSLLAQNGLNLTKIESRPIHGRPFEYRFFVDFEFDQAVISLDGASNAVDAVLNQFKAHTSSFRCMGIYPKAERVVVP